MKGLRSAMLVAVLATGFATGAAAQAPATCGATLDAKARLLAEVTGWQVVFVPKPAPVAVGRHFSLELAVCSRDPAARVTAVRVDAEMPAHRHGMNYAAKVSALGGDRYRADGLMFHMPGHWRFIIELTLTDGKTVRLTRDVELQ